MEENKKTFHWADYLVFSASLVVSLLIGVYFAFDARRKKATSSADFLLAGRNAQVLPVAMSMLASFLSAIFILGIPSEILLNGTMFLTCFTGYLGSAVIGAQLYVPVFHKMGLTSVYGYLETRFNKTVRILASITFILMMIFYMAVVLFAPAVAFSTVTGLSMWITIFAIGVICTLYTALGGMKAVIWTDTFQMLVILLGLVALLIKGSIDTGGIVNVWEKNVEGGRIDFTYISPDPRERHTWWTQSIGVTINTLTLIAGNQIVIQRYLSVRTVKEAQISIYLALSGGYVCIVLCGLLGLVIYAYYDCDPVSQGRRAEEVVPMFMMEVMGHLHGLPGLFTASVFAASLSTVSSAVQALAAVFTDDIIRPLYLHCNLKEMSERITIWIAKGLALFFGLLTIGLSYISPYLGPFLIQIALSILGTAGGPLFGLFTLAIFFPCANSWGAGVGLLTSIIFTYWINIGAITIGVSPTRLPPHYANCTSHTTVNSTEMYVTTERIIESIPEPGVFELYRISYMWYGTVSVLTTILVGLLVSAITGFRRGQPALDPKLVFSYGGKCCCSCSGEQCGDTWWPVKESQNSDVKGLGQGLKPLAEEKSIEINGPENMYSDHNGIKICTRL